MIHCPSCQQPATKRDGYDDRGRQRYSCPPCHRDFTATSTSAFSGYRWPADLAVEHETCEILADSRKRLIYWEFFCMADTVPLSDFAPLCLFLKVECSAIHRLSD